MRKYFGYTSRIKAICALLAAFLVYVPQQSQAHAGVYGPFIAEATENTPASHADTARFRLQPGQDSQAARLDSKRKLVNRLEVVYQALGALDAAETISCLQNPRCKERNPILGGRPSTGTVVGFKLGTGALHYVISRILLKKDPNKAILFEGVSIAIQGTVCALNLRHSF